MKTYPLFKAHISSEEALRQIQNVFASGFINEGEQVTELTAKLQKYLGVNLLLTNSCTSALTLALHLSNVKPGDEVISTPMTCVATNAPIVAAGAKIVWADIDPKTGMIDPDDVVKKLTPKTKAVIAVAWAGSPPRLKALRKICDKAGISLILDAAHAFGAEFRCYPVWGWADFTAYSFQAIKHFTTGDGGGLHCLNDEQFLRAKKLKWFGLDRDHVKDLKGDWKGQQWDADIVEAGYKFNMNNVSAAIGLSQLESIDTIINAHRFNARVYKKMFKKCTGLETLKHSRRNESSFWVYTMLARTQKDRDDLLLKLNSEGIMAGLVHVPNNQYTAFQASKTDLPGVREFSSRQFSLPCGWWLDEQDVKHIASRVIELSK